MISQVFWYCTQNTVGTVLAKGIPLQFANLSILWSCPLSFLFDVSSPGIVTSTSQTGFFPTAFFTHSFLMFSVVAPAIFAHWSMIFFAAIPVQHCCDFIMSFQIVCLCDLPTAAYQVIHCLLCFFAQSALAVIVWIVNRGLDCNYATLSALVLWESGFQCSRL